VGDEALQRFIAEACLLGDGFDASDSAARHDLAEPDRAAVTAAPQRVLLYRRLVRNNLLGVVGRMMPRARARVNDPWGAFDASFDAFLAEVAPRTHYLRDVPAEFLAWAGPGWALRTGVPGYAADLAAYELVHFQIAAAPPLSAAAAVDEVALDRRLVFCPARRLVRFGHAVHELGEDLEDRTEPEQRSVALLAYRDPENTVRFLELSPLAASLAERLLTGDALGVAVAAACTAVGTPVTPEILSGTARVLADWGERGLLLGAEPVDGP
jgi:hypothetical protein